MKGDVFSPGCSLVKDDTKKSGEPFIGTGNPNPIFRERKGGGEDGDTAESHEGATTKEWFDLQCEDSSTNTMKQSEGILILSGSDASDPVERVCVSSQEQLSRSIVLSIPGTDSIPSSVGSLSFSEHLAYKMAWKPPMNTDPVKDTTPLKPKHQAHTADLVGPSSPTLPLDFWKKNSRSRFWLLFFLAASAYLAWDRYSWRQSALALQEEIIRLKEELSRQPDVSVSVGGLESEGYLGAKMGYIIDNCWLRARFMFTFTLGGCAIEAKESLKKAALDIKNWLWSYCSTSSAAADTFSTQVSLKDFSATVARNEADGHKIRTISSFGGKEDVVARYDSAAEERVPSTDKGNNLEGSTFDDQYWRGWHGRFFFD